VEASAEKKIFFICNLLTNNTFFSSFILVAADLNSSIDLYNGEKLTGLPVASSSKVFAPLYNKKKNINKITQVQ
jgi:hypothetical protein